MKHTRRRRHLRPRPTRSQIHHQMRRIGRTMQLLQLEALVEVQKPKPDLPRLRFLNDAIGGMRDEAVSLERF
jgi:hypothetical protein